MIFDTPLSRQIIKARSQRPYVIARIVIALFVIIALIAVVLYRHAHSAPSALREDFIFAALNSPSPLASSIRFVTIA